MKLPLNFENSGTMNHLGFEMTVCLCMTNLLAKLNLQLPFKEDHELLPDNFALSKSRLVSLLKRLNLKPEVLKHYDDVIRDQEKQGIVEPVEQGTNNGVGKVHYLPHHEVIRVDKDTTKLRIVYDASARSGRNTPSLNDCLYAGPPLSLHL